MEIVREYDIRGIYPSEFNEKTAREFGRKLGTFAKEKIFLNYDNRIGSIRTRGDFELGLNETGKDIIEGPLGPLTAVALQSFINKGIGVSLTASHNPPQYTGIITYVNGKTLKPINFANTKAKIVKKIGQIQYSDFNNDYKDFLINRLKRMKVKVGFDAMGGSTTKIGREILENLTEKVIQIRDKFDYNFFNDSPEPSEERSRKLAELVVKERLDFGMQVDADGDRIAIIDDKGNFVNIARIDILIGKILNYRKLVTTVSSPKILEKYFDVEYTPVGRPFIEEKMRGRVLGLESSGHLYFSEFYPFSDGILSGLLVAKIIDKTKKQLSVLLKDIPNVLFYEDKINTENRDKALKKIEELLKTKGKLNKMDGVRIDIGNAFILFRKSNTEPVIRVYVSSTNENDFEKMLSIARNIMKQI